MPRLWSDTIEAHREEVRAAILDAAWALATERGLSAVTMSQIAERAGIGRATLYKYFPDVGTILVAWHERHVAGHLADLVAIRDGAGEPGERLEAALRLYATIAHRRGNHSAEIGAVVHRGDGVERVQRQVRDVVRDLIAGAASAGEARTDVDPNELAAYCLHALRAAGGLKSRAAVERLVAVTLSGLRPDA